LVFRASKLFAFADAIRSMGGEVALVDGSEVHAGGTAIESVSGTVRIEQSKVLGTIGVRALFQTEMFDARGAHIEGSKAAMDMHPVNGMRMSVVETKIVGNRWGFGAQ